MKIVPPEVQCRGLNGVYRLQIGQHSYIGSCSGKKGFNKRWGTHLSKLITGKHASKKMLNCFNKYQELIFSVLEVCSPEQCIEREQYYIDTLKPDLNIRTVAHSNLGLPVSEETRLKLKIAQTGRIKSEETRRRLSIANKGKPVIKTKETLLKISVALKGRKLTEEHKIKIGLSNKKHTIPLHVREAQRLAKSKTVMSINSSGEIKIYSPIKAVKIDGFNPGSVIRNCKGFSQKYKNHRWSYVL